MLNIGLIGAGRWGRRYIKTLDSMPGARLARLASRNSESQLLAPSGCAITPNWYEIAEDSSLDGVIIAVPPSLHAEVAEVAMASGIPVLIEKPMTLSLAEAQRLVNISESTQSLIIVGHTHLFSEAFRTLKQHAQKLGPLQKIRSSAGNWGPCRAGIPMLWDWAPHDIAMCLDMLGTNPSTIFADRTGVEKLPGGEGETVEIKLNFSSGVQASIRVSNIDENKSRYFEACFEEGALIYDDLAPEKLCMLSCASEASTPIAIRDSPPLSNLLTEFFSEIQAGSNKHESLRLGLRVVEILDQCQTLMPQPIECQQK